MLVFYLLRSQLFLAGVMFWLGGLMGLGVAMVFAPTDANAATIAAVVGAGFALAGVLMLSRGWGGAKLRSRALMLGEPIEGRITRSEKVRRGRLDNYREVFVFEYEWTGIDGVKRRGFAPPVKKTVLRLGAGEKVRVFVRPSHPEVGEIDVSGARERASTAR